MNPVIDTIRLFDDPLSQSLFTAKKVPNTTRYQGVIAMSIEHFTSGERRILRRPDV